MGECKRIEWIDALRMFAIFGVVLCHATEGIYRLELDYINVIHIQSKIFAFLAFSIGRLGVPFFLMISGYLLLDRDYDNMGIKRFWKNNWFHLLICTEIWFLVYEVFLKFCLKQDIGVLQVVEDLLFIHKVNMSHVWYLPMILGMYVLIPFVANVLKFFKLKCLIFPVCIFTLFGFGYPFLQVINNVLEHEPLSLQMSLGFSGGVYGIYFVFGYLIKKGLLKKMRSFLLVIVSCISLIGCVGLQIWAYNQDFKYNIWYDSPFILISSVAIFELFSRIQKVPVYQVVKLLAKYSFAIYLIHNMIRLVLVKKLSTLAFMQPMKVVLLWSVVLVLSLICSWLISLIPKIGKYILYLK